MSLPENVDIVRVRGNWFKQDGTGNEQTITFAPLVSNLIDADAFAYIKTSAKTVTPDPTSGYFFADLIASNDPDLTPSAWTVTLQGQAPFTIGVDYNATTQEVSPGVFMKAVWLVDAAGTGTPPAPIDTYYTSVQTNAAIAEALDGFESSSAVLSVAGRTGDVVLAEADVTNLTTDLGAKTVKATLTTKGDLYVASAASTPARLGVGTNGQVLTADSSQTTGTKWGDPTPSGVATVTAGDATVTVAGTSSDPTVAVNAIPESKVTNLVTDLAGKAATVHVHAGADITTGTVAIGRIPTGTTGSTVPFGNDSRFSDARTPTAHHTSHNTGGSDAIAPSDIGAAAATHTHAESDVTSLVSDLAGKQPLDSDLTAIAALAPADGTFIKRASSAWTAATLVKGDVGLGSVDNTSDATKNSATATLTNKTLTSPAITSPTGLVKADVGLSNVDNVSSATERAATATLTNKTLTSPAITSPTGIVKGDVGLGNCDNTADSAKPVSSAQLTALNGKLALSTVTTKGDIVAATASATVARLGVGSNNQVLTADSSTSTGLKWAAAASGSVASVTAGDATVTIGGTSTDPTVAVAAATLAALAPVASPTFTGTATFAKTVSAPVALTDASTIVVDASLGNLFRVTLGGNRTMGVPSTPSDGQQILFELIQDGTGSRTVTWSSSTGGFAFDVPTPVLNTTAGARDFVEFVYNATANKWRFASAPSGITDISAADVTIVIAGTDTSPTVAVGAIAESQVTNLTSDLAAKVPLATATTKGDLLAATASATVARLGVGTDGKVLTADSGQTTGLNWTTPTVGTVTGVTAANSTITVAGTSAAPTVAVNAIAESQVTNLVTDLAAKQPLDSDLTAIAALAPSDGTYIKRASGAWTAASIAEADVTGLVSDLAGKQASNSNLTAIAALTPTADNFLGGSGGAWANRTPAQAKTSLGITEADVSGLVSDLAGKQPLDSDLTAFAALSPADGTYVKRASGAWTASSIAAGDIGSGTVASARLPLVVSTPYTVTYSTTITMDPTLGNNAQMTATGPSTMGISTTGALNGQQILLEVLASLAQRTITFTGINILPGLSSVNAVTSSKVGFFAFRYSSLDTSWHLMSSGISS